MQYKVLISWKVSDEFLDTLTENLATNKVYQNSIVMVNQADRKTLQEEIRDADILLAGSADKELLEYGKNLKLIQSLTASVKRIDLDYTENRNITVCSGKGPNAPSVAEHTVMLMLMLCKQYKDSPREWLGGRLETDELYGKSVGIIGVGHTGEGTARRLRGFDVKLYGIDIYPEKIPDYFESSGTDADIDIVLPEVDFLTLHVPSTKRTRNMIDEKKLRKMKKNAYLVNMARGDVVDIDALYRALANHELAGAAADVFPNEPVNFEHPIFGMDNFIYTTHIAASSKASRRRMASFVAENLKRFAENRELSNVVNKEEGF